jgi:arginyl-tRNA synthetase
MRVAAAHLGTMARINVAYDLLPRESEILHLRFWERAFELLKERGALYFVDSGKHRGCWVMRTSEEAPDREAPGARAEVEDDEKIIVRSDGTVTYVGKDIAYQLWKFGLLGLDFHYRPLETAGGRTVWTTALRPVPGAAPPAFGGATRVYNVIDTRQSYLQGVVLQGLRALGFEEQARNSVHFSYEMVALTPACCEELGFQLSDEDRKRAYVEVSGRKGLGVKADDLLDALLAKALAEVQARHALPEAESRAIASQIAVGALRYFLLRYALTTVIAFDFKEALSFDGETGPYVQYAAVRANNIFKKLEEAGETVDVGVVDPGALDAFLREHDEIWELIYQAARLPEAVRQATASLEMAQLAKYAFGLAQRFNLFYHKFHILSETDPARRRHLLLAVELVRRQLEKALELLGCGVPPRM